MSLPPLHLTTVRHLGPRRWEAACHGCDWRSDVKGAKAEAVMAAEFHWYAAQDAGDGRQGPAS